MYIRSKEEKVNLVLDDMPRYYKLKKKENEPYDGEKYRGVQIDFDLNAIK